MITAVSFTVVSLFAFTQQPEPVADAGAEKSATAIEHVTVVPAHRDGVLHNQTVLLEDGRILAVAPSSLLQVPERFESVDGLGKFLVPGYVDSHAHFPGTAADDIPVPLYLQMMVENGVTRLRCMRLTPQLPLWAAKVDAGEVVGPKLHYPVALFSNREDLAEDNLRRRLQEAAERSSADGSADGGMDGGVDGLKGRSGQPRPYAKMLGGFAPETYQRLMKIAGEYGIQVAGHLPFGVELEMAVESGQIGIEHFHGFDRKQKLPLPELRRRLELSRKAGIYHCPTIFWNAVQGGHLSLGQLNQLAGVDWLPKAVTTAWHASMIDATQEHWRKPMEPNRPLMIRILKHMAASGGRVLLSASNGEYVVPGYSLHEEIKVYQEAELTPFQILQAATYTAAQFFAATDQFGSIQPGLHADVVLLNSNPLADASHLNDIAAVWVGGQRMPTISK